MRSRPQNGPHGGEMISVSVCVSVLRMRHGIKQEVTINRLENAKSATEPERKGNERRTCPTCNGTGQERVQQQTMFGSFVNVQPCPVPAWRRRTIVDSPCESAKGKGTVQQQRTISVNIPAGIDNGQILTMRGEGHAGKQGGRRETCRL